MRIRELRKEKKLTQEEMARRLNVGRTTYLGYESGKIEIPTKRLESLAEMFGVTLDYLAGKSDYRTFAEEMDATHDVDALRREVITREFAKNDLIRFLRIAIDELESRDYRCQR